MRTRSLLLLGMNHMPNAPEAVYDLCAFHHTRQQHTGAEEAAALIVLNSNSFSTALLNALWISTHVRICADGGANRLFDLHQNLVPDSIVGDLDSIRPHVRDFYMSHGVDIHQDSDQDCNDLDKSIQLLWRKYSDITSISVLGAFGGRFDQEMATMDAIYRWSQRWPLKYQLYSDQNVAALLSPTLAPRHRIRIRPELEGPTCGLLPIGAPCDRVTTTGLRWNLADAPLAFGHLVSTSNIIDADEICIQASQPLVWTAEMNQLPPLL